MNDMREKEEAVRNFDDAAALWDEEPRRVRLACDVAAALRGEVAVNRHMNVLDYGCGTGLVTLCLQPHVRSITGADPSPGMLEALRGKIKARALDNVEAFLIVPGDQGLPSGSFHLVVSSMALHHIEDVKAVFRDFYRILLPGGLLAVADLDREDGSFHGRGIPAAHCGFDRGRMRVMLEETGFRKVRDTTATTVEKTDRDGVVRTYTIFLITAEK